MCLNRDNLSALVSKGHNNHLCQLMLGACMQVAVLKAIYKRQVMGTYLAEWCYQAAKQAMEKQANKLHMKLTVRRCCYYLCTTPPFFCHWLGPAAPACAPERCLDHMPVFCTAPADAPSCCVAAVPALTSHDAVPAEPIQILHLANLLLGLGLMVYHLLMTSFLQAASLAYILHFIAM